jgi:hypothetical protein
MASRRKFIILSTLGSDGVLVGCQRQLLGEK